MAVTALLEHNTLRAETLAVAAQCTSDEALDTLVSLERADVLSRLVNRSRAFQLSPGTRSVFGSRIRYPVRRKLEEHRDLVLAYLESAPQIGREELTDLIGVTATSASRILANLARSGDLVPVANARGAGVRYKLPNR